MELLHKNRQKSKQLNNLFETVKIPVSQPSRNKGSYHSKNLSIVAPEPQAAFQNMEPILNKITVERKKKFFRLGKLIPIVLIALIIGGFTATFFMLASLGLKNSQLEREAAELLREYQAVDKQYFELKEHVGKSSRRAGELENLNKFLLTKVADQQKELEELSYMVTEQVFELKRQMKMEQEVVLEKQSDVLGDRYNKLLTQQKKAFHELFFNSYDEENKTGENAEQPVPVDRIFS